MVHLNELGWSVLRVAVATYLGLTLFMFFRQSRYVYYPARELRITPATARLPYEDVQVRTSDGETIHGWYVPHPQARATVLICHGNAGNIADRIDSLWRFHDFGVNVCIFDYRGYGRSTGKPSEAGTYRDAEAVWAWLTGTRGIATNRIALFGESLGGGVASWLAVQKRPGALVLESTFTSVPDLAARLYPFLPARWLCRIRYDTLSRMPSIACPVLVAHSETDEMIPFAHGRKLFEAAGEPKTFFVMKGSHNGGREQTGKAYDEAVEGFLSACFGARQKE